MRLRMGAGIHKVPANQVQAPAALVQSGANEMQSFVQQLEM